MRRAILLSLLTVAAPLFARDAPPKEEKPLVQLAVLLDTSGSMSGMINQARNQLWAIVNEFLEANRDGQKPRLQVALYHYGSPGLGKEDGYIRQLTPLTEDLDKVSEELFKLTTSGGDEYCGWAIRTAMNELQWSKSSKDYRAIFIAGNEPFDQGPVTFKKVCKQAIEKGIIINTIHCSGGADDHWKDGAALADGRYLKIDTDQVVVDIETPFDKDLADLGQKLNGTYIAYGAKGEAAAARQAAVDSKSMSLGAGNFAKRARSKASGYYKNSSWDLVDADKESEVDLAKVKKEDLPEEMREMTVGERKAYVDGKGKERVELQKQIAELSVKRDDFVAKQRADLAGNESTLGDQVRETVRDQAVELGFEF